jgi:hypothetical protein
MRSCAAYAIGSLGLKTLEDHLDRWVDDPDPLLRETVRAAKERLAQVTLPSSDPSSEPSPAEEGWDPTGAAGVG